MYKRNETHRNANKEPSRFVNQYMDWGELANLEFGNWLMESFPTKVIQSASKSWFGRDHTLASSTFYYSGSESETKKLFSKIHKEKLVQYFKYPRAGNIIYVAFFQVKGS